MIPKEVEYITIISQNGSNFVIGRKSSIHSEYMNGLLKGKPQDNSIGNHSYTLCNGDYYNLSTLVLICKYRTRDVILTTIESVSMIPLRRGMTYYVNATTVARNPQPANGPDGVR